MQSARQSIKPFLVIGETDDQGRQRDEEKRPDKKTKNDLAPRRKGAKIGRS